MKAQKVDEYTTKLWQRIASEWYRDLTLPLILSRGDVAELLVWFDVQN